MHISINDHKYILTTEDADAEDGDIEADEELEDWVDDHDLSELTLEEHQQLQDHICPVKMVLVRVCHIAMIIYSPEINASQQIWKLAFKICTH